MFFVSSGFDPVAPSESLTVPLCIQPLWQCILRNPRPRKANSYFQPGASYLFGIRNWNFDSIWAKFLTVAKYPIGRAPVYLEGVLRRQFLYNNLVYVVREFSCTKTTRFGNHLNELRSVDLRCCRQYTRASPVAWFKGLQPAYFTCRPGDRIGFEFYWLSGISSGGWFAPDADPRPSECASFLFFAYEMPRLKRAPGTSLPFRPLVLLAAHILGFDPRASIINTGAARERTVFGCLKLMKTEWPVQEPS